MNPRKLVPIAAAIAFLLSLTVSRAHAVTLFPYEYDWTSNNAGFTGKIFFDASSNAHGSLSDIDLANSFFTTPATTYYLSDSFSGTSLSGTLSWNPSQITSMNISGAQAIIIFEVFWNASAQSVSDDAFAFGIFPIGGNSDHGSWVAASRPGNTVPDESSTLGLFAIAVITLGCASRCVQRRTCRVFAIGL